MAVFNPENKIALKLTVSKYQDVDRPLVHFSAIVLSFVRLTAFIKCTTVPEVQWAPKNCGEELPHMGSSSHYLLCVVFVFFFSSVPSWLSKV